MGKTGIDEALQGQVADLAAHGFVSIASDMFHREDPNAPDYDTANMRVLDVNIKKDVNVAISTLKAHALVDPKRIGIVGFCMGGRISYLMATRNSEIKAAAVYYGGNIMKPRGDGPSPFEQTAKISCPGYRTFRSRGRKPFTCGCAKDRCRAKAPWQGARIPLVFGRRACFHGQGQIQLQRARGQRCLAQDIGLVPEAPGCSFKDLTLATKYQPLEVHPC